MDSNLYQVRGECVRLCDQIWSKHTEKWKNRMKADAWIEGHIGRKMMKASMDDLLLLVRLLYEKKKDGRCSLHMGTETTPQRRRRRMGPVSRYERLRKEILAERGMKCEECGRELTVAEVTFDHTIPVFKGGLTEKANLKILCGVPCHKRKTKRENKEALAMHLESLRISGMIRA